MIFTLSGQQVTLNNNKIVSDKNCYYTFPQNHLKETYALTLFPTTAFNMNEHPEGDHTVLKIHFVR